MEQASEEDKRSENAAPDNLDSDDDGDSALEPILKSWGAYCFARVDGKTRLDADDFSKYLEAIPETIRKKK